MEKQEKDMVELHKRCVKNYLVQRSLKHGKIKKFFIVYDYYLGTENIRNYFFRPIDMFVRFLLLGKLEEIEDYVKADSRKKKRKHKRSKSMVSSESKTIRRKNGRDKLDQPGIILWTSIFYGCLLEKCFTLGKKIL